MKLFLSSILSLVPLFIGLVSCEIQIVDEGFSSDFKAKVLTTPPTDAEAQILLDRYYEVLFENRNKLYPDLPQCEIDFHDLRWDRALDVDLQGLVAPTNQELDDANAAAQELADELYSNQTRTELNACVRANRTDEVYSCDEPDWCFFLCGFVRVTCDESVFANHGVTLNVWNRKYSYSGFQQKITKAYRKKLDNYTITTLGDTNKLLIDYDGQFEQIEVSGD